jgi:Ser/Thr protein kinase RdoA (MazF antagonist)
LGQVLSRYPHLPAPDRGRFLGSAGGFSGAALWRVETRDGDYCLRGWPRQLTDPRRLAWIHANLRTIAAACPVVPVPLATRDQTTWFVWEGRLWELAPWLPGQADDRSAPGATKLQAAMRTLARLHAAASGAAGDRVGPSPSLVTRLTIMRHNDQEVLDAIERKLAGQPRPPWDGRARELLSRYRQVASTVSRELQAVQNVTVPLQVCHGDLWREHVLFRREQVSGIIDFGAMKVESPATDIARLLGSWAGDDPQLWQAGLMAYQQMRPLRDAVNRLIEVFDHSTTLLAGVNWLKWLLLEERQFDSPRRVLERLDEILERLANLATRQ